VRAGNNRIPRSGLWVGFLGLRVAPNVVGGIVDDQQIASLLLFAIELRFVDDAQVAAATAGLRLRIFLPQPKGHDRARPLDLVGATEGGPLTIAVDAAELPASGGHRIERANPGHRIGLARRALPRQLLGRGLFLGNCARPVRVPDLLLFRGLRDAVRGAQQDCCGSRGCCGQLCEFAHRRESYRLIAPPARAGGGSAWVRGGAYSLLRRGLLSGPASRGASSVDPWPEDAPRMIRSSQLPSLGGMSCAACMAR